MSCCEEWLADTHVGGLCLMATPYVERVWQCHVDVHSSEAGSWSIAQADADRICVQEEGLSPF